MRLRIVALLVAVATLTGCTDSDVRKVKKAANDISISLSAAETLNENLYNSKEIDGAQSAALAELIARAVNANEAFIATASGITAITPDSKQKLIASIQLVTDQLRVLQAQGAFGIKSQAGVSAFNSYLAAISSSLQVIQAVIGDIYAPLPTVTPAVTPTAFEFNTAGFGPRYPVLHA